MEHIVYLNGALLPEGQARISPLDLGFLYGYGLFETMRSYSGHIFRLRQHLERLARSAAVLGIPVETGPLERACYDVLRANSLTDARVRLAVSIGEGKGTPDPPPSPQPTTFISAASYAPLPHDTYRNGFKAATSSIRQNSQSPLSRMKSANYLDHVLARKAARAAGADEALLLNERGFLCEGSTTNIFLVSKGGLLTPDEESGCLAGVTRQAVINLALHKGMSVDQREIRPDELAQADEAFVTNSVLELMPLSEVDGQPIGDKRSGRGAGAVTERLMDAYKELVARETTGPR